LRKALLENIYYRNKTAELKILKEPPPTGVGEDEGKKEPSYTVGGNVNYYNHSGKKSGGYLKT
jgi:hypothetical protein